MSRYIDKNGKEVICSRAEYIAEMEKRQVAKDRPARQAKKGGK